MSLETVTLLDRRTNETVEAVLHMNLDRSRLVAVAIDWSPERLRALQRRLEQEATATQLPEHAHWNWAVKTLRYAHLQGYRCLGIEANGKMQGLIMVSLSNHLARSDPDAGKPLVYVEFVETAPWNDRTLTDDPVYKGVGRRLMQVVARLSVAESRDGRVGLHSLGQSKLFYTGACGMTAFGPDPDSDDLEYFELTAVQAQELMRD